MEHVEENRRRKSTPLLHRPIHPNIRTALSDVEPARFFVHRHIRPQYACRACETVCAAPIPPAVIDGGLAAVGLYVWVIIGKFLDHLPLYRLEQIAPREDVTLSRVDAGAGVDASAWRCGRGRSAGRVHRWPRRAAPISRHRCASSPRVGQDQAAGLPVGVSRILRVWRRVRRSWCSIIKPSRAGMHAGNFFSVAGPSDGR